MRQWSNAAAAVALLAVLFAVSIPQINSSFFAARDRVTESQNIDQVVPSTAADRPQADASSAGAAVIPPAQPKVSAANLPVETASSPTPTQAPANSAPKHIALQAGHWKYKEAPDPLNRMTGTSGGGKTEPEITLSIANETAKILRSWGHTVDILPTVIPSGFKADLFVSIHTDGNNSPNPRGFFTDRPASSSITTAETRLQTAIDSEYARSTGIPYTYRSTEGSRYYYGYRQVASSVPRVLIETGFLTNALDQEILIKQPQKSAEGIANGIKKYLAQ